MTPTLYAREARESGEEKVRSEECPMCNPKPPQPGWKRELKEVALEVGWFLSFCAGIMLVIGLLWAWGGKW